MHSTRASFVVENCALSQDVELIVGDYLCSKLWYTGFLVFLGLRGFNR